MATKRNDSADESTTTAPGDNTDSVLYPEVSTVTEEQAAQARAERDEQLLNDDYVQGRTEPPATDRKDVNTPGRGSDPDLPAHRQAHPVGQAHVVNSTGAEQAKDATTHGDRSDRGDNA